MKNGKTRPRTLALCLGAVIVAVALAVSLASDKAGAQPKASYARSETLVTGGTQSGYISGFNPYSDYYAVGTVGLCNETLLRYDPLKDKYINWLARSAGFTGKRVYTVNVRPGIRWSNGQKFKGKDVRFNFRLGRFSTAYWHGLYSTLAAIKVSGLKVTFWFKGTPNYIQWQNLVWNLPMINPAQGAKITGKTLTTYNPKNPIGTGPYELDPAGYDPTVRVVWKKKAVWWAAQQKIAPSPKPKHVIDLVESCGGAPIHALCSCLDHLSSFLSKIEDLSTAYLPGIQNVVAEDKAQTYYPRKPYDLSANTAWLEVNTTKPALNDKAFRRALATSINVDNIVKSDYGDMVMKANATGLLPTWKKWVDQGQARSLGFRFSTEGAKSLLAAAGYKDTNGDGYVENKDGTPIDLKIAVPQGWSDWESARDMIIVSAKAAGIHLHADEGDFNHWQTERNSGAFDLVIDDSYQLSDNPWTYYKGIFHLPVLKIQTSANFGRYENAAAWRLTEKLDKTPLGNVKQRKAIIKKLQKIQLTDLPIIPLWYNGLWSQTQSAYWKNWPSSTSTRNYIPSIGRGYLQMTGIDMVTHLKAA